MTATKLVDQAVILARGLGTRMRSDAQSAQLDPSQSVAADSGMKAMIPFGRPFLDFVLSGLADAQYQSACIVIGPEHSVVQEYYARIKPQRIRVHFAIQAKPIGTADAVLTAQEFADGQEFIVLNGDNLYPLEVLAALRDLGQPGAPMFDEESLVRNSNIPADRIRSFAYGTIDNKSFLTDLVEKPDESDVSDLRVNSLISMNCWRFSSEIFPACRNVSLSSRGEYELPVAVREAVRSGMQLKIVRSTAGVLDLSRRSDVSAVAERLKEIPVSL
jgi:glucose-1-phosphate thymidylyltransferase